MTVPLVLWSASTTLAAPALRAMLRLRVQHGKEISARLPERRGIEPAARPAGRLVWLHAASVGETVSVLPVVAALTEQAADANVLLTTGTVTSAVLLATRLEPGLARRVLHRFAPLDVPAWVARFLDHWQPDVAAFVESELWPNLIAGCRTRRIPLLLLNARMSPRSFARWRRLPALAADLLGGFDQVLAQSEADADRLRALGARAVTAPGNLKFAAPPLPVDESELARIGGLIGARPIWLAASTHPGEETIVAEAHRVLAPTHPDLLTVIAPRHPERGAEVAAAAAPVVVTRRAAGDGPPAEQGVWVADTLGELGLFFRLARIVLMGRSLLAPGGGQNPLEPARLGCAIATGPFTGNFAAVTEALEREGALVRVTGSVSLAAWVDAMLNDPARRCAMGVAGAAAARRSADLPGRLAALLLDLASARVRPDLA